MPEVRRLTPKYRHERDWRVEVDWKDNVLATVKVVHELGPLLLDVGEPQLSATGGKTTCSLVDEDGQVAAQGVAFCHPEDNFVKQVGRDLALRRAIKALFDIGEESDVQIIEVPFHAH